MTNLTIEMVKEMGRKELQAVAKSFGINAGLKNKALMTLIESALSAETSTDEPKDFFADETAATTTVNEEVVADSEGVSFFDEEPQNKEEIIVKEVVVNSPLQKRLGETVVGEFDVNVGMTFEQMETLMELEVGQFSPIAGIQEQVAQLYADAKLQRNAAFNGNFYNMKEYETAKEVADHSGCVSEEEYAKLMGQCRELNGWYEASQKENINRIAGTLDAQLFKNRFGYLASIADALVNRPDMSREMIAERLESCLENMITLMVDIKLAHEGEVKFDRVTEKRKPRNIRRDKQSEAAASEPKASEQSSTVAVDKLSAIGERRFAYANRIAGIRYLASNYHMNKAVASEQWVEVVDYNEVIKENKDAWANEDAAAASEPSASERQQEQQPQEDADAVASVDYDKVFEYVGSNNLGVKFLQKGVMVTIAWSKQHSVPFIKVGDNKAKTQMIQTAIDKFKKFKNGEHGDIAQIVKALTRIKKMPAEVLASKKQKERATKEGSSSARKENTSTRRRSGTVDADWLAEYRREFEATHDRQPTGIEIKSAWESVQA